MFVIDVTIFWNVQTLVLTIKLLIQEVFDFCWGETPKLLDSLFCEFTTLCESACMYVCDWNSEMV